MRYRKGGTRQKNAHAARRNVCAIVRAVYVLCTFCFLPLVLLVLRNSLISSHACFTLTFCSFTFCFIPRKRTSPVCFRLRVLRHQHCIHRLFPECGTRPSGHGHHPAAWFYPHPVLFLADAHPVGSTGNLAGCPRFRTADLSFCHYHLLSQKTKLKIYYLCACINAEKYESFY